MKIPFVLFEQLIPCKPCELQLFSRFIILSQGFEDEMMAVLCSGYPFSFPLTSLPALKTFLETFTSDSIQSSVDGL